MTGERNKIEFDINDGVTYAPYEKEFDIKITGVDVRRNYVTNQPATHDPRIFYSFTLQGIPMECTGKCIKESIYYESY